MLYTHTHTLPALSVSSDVDMEVDHFTNGVTESSSNGFLNGSSKHITEPEECEADMGECCPHPCFSCCANLALTELSKS